MKQLLLALLLLSAPALADFSGPIALPGQLPGTTTNDNAAAGNVGEFISSTVVIGSAVVLTNATSANITSVSLTAGDWDCRGNAVTAPTGATTTSFIETWISTTTATLPTLPNAGAASRNFVTGTSSNDFAFVLPAVRFTFSATTTVFLSINVNFAVSTMGAYGFLGCRRVR